MKPAVKQISPAKCFRIYEQARTKGSAYFTLPGSNQIVFARNACIQNGFVYAECMVKDKYTAFRIETMKGSGAQVAFINSNTFVSPF